MHEPNSSTEGTPSDADTLSIPTSNGPSVLIDRADFDALTPDHRGAWFWNSNGRGNAYVRVRRAAQLDGKQPHPYASRPSRTKLPQHTTLARIITKAGLGQQVRFRNGQPNDLRSENLALT